MKASIYVTLSIKDLMLFYSCSFKTAYSRLVELRKKFSKKRITIRDLSVYEGYPPSELLEFFYPI